MIRDPNDEEVPWKVTEEKVAEAVKTIAHAANPVKIFVFGSYVRGSHGRSSDLDMLVVLREEPGSPRAESIRLRDAVSHVRMPMDIFVVSDNRLRELSERPGLIYREILRSGRVVYAAG
ncbi:MAG: nucleotidyltransferase domain-containing protein [bacterium]